MEGDLPPARGRSRASSARPAAGARLFAPPLPVAAAAGLCLGFYPHFLPAAPLCLLALGAAAFGIAALGLARPLWASLGRAALVFGAFAAAGLLLDRGRDSRQAGLAQGRLRPICLSGRLARDSSTTRGGATLYRIEVESLRLRGPGLGAELSPGRGGGSSLARVDVLVRGGPLLDAGARVLCGLGAGAGGGSLLFAQARDLAVLDRGAPVEAFRSRLRDGARQALHRVGERSAGLLLALILGARDSLDREDADAFRAAGCSHILALSGQHLSILALVAVLLLKPLLGPLRARVGAAIFAALFVWLAGASPSLFRAGLMAWIGALAALLDRPQPWVVVIALSLVVSLPLDPEGARSLSFALSYLAVLGLALLAPRAAFLVSRWLPPPLATAVAASLAAQLATAPLVVLTFGTLSAVGVPAAVVAAPLVTVFMWWGLGAALLCTLLPGMAPAAAWVSDLLYSLLSGVMRAAAAAPSLVTNGPGGRAAMALVVAAAAALVYARFDVDFLFWSRRRAAGLRCAHGAQGPARARGPGHVEALRTELPREPDGS